MVSDFLEALTFEQIIPACEVGLRGWLILAATAACTIAVVVLNLAQRRLRPTTSPGRQLRHIQVMSHRAAGMLAPVAALEHNDWRV